MKPPRVSTTTLTALVAVVALDLAVGRALWGYHRAMLLGAVLTGPALQIGLLRFCLAVGRDRAFWGGFVAAGSAALLTVHGATAHPFSPSWVSWTGYTRFALAGLGRLPFAPALLDPGRLGALPVSAWEITFAVVLALPQALAALAGGFLARGLAPSAGQRRPSSSSLR